MRGICRRTPTSSRRRLSPARSMYSIVRSILASRSVVECAGRTLRWLASIRKGAVFLYLSSVCVLTLQQLWHGMEPEQEGQHPWCFRRHHSMSVVSRVYTSTSISSERLTQLLGTSTLTRRRRLLSSLPPSSVDTLPSLEYVTVLWCPTHAHTRLM